MRNKLYISFLMLLLIFFFACESTMGPNEIGGDTEIDLTKVGNEYGASLNIAGERIELDEEIFITENDNGIVTVSVEIPKSSIVGTKYEPLLSLIPSEFKDELGNISTEIKFKATSEGIQDFYYSNNDLSKPFTIIKYSSGVGDSYSFTTEDGEKITRKVISKSDEDDYDLVFWLIKTTVVEQDKTDIAGVKNVKFRANHKFGLVEVVYVLEDNQEIVIKLLPWGVL